VQRQAESSVLLIGLGALGIEVAKNITLAGVKRLTLFDNRVVTPADLSGQFFVDENDVKNGTTRAEACINRLR
jgi:molybdopterin/thiamine biosynthesis adenylyltransferase